MTNEIETVKRWAAKLGFKLEPFPAILRETVGDVLANGLLTAAGLASRRGISPTAASNRLRAAQRVGLLQEAPLGKEIVFELSPGAGRYPWIGNEKSAECLRCGHAPAPEKGPDADLELDDPELPYGATGDVLT